MLRLFILLAYLMNAAPTLLGQDLLAGQIQVEQVSPATVEVHFEILTEIHQTLEYLSVCWGDGFCEELPLVSFEELPMLDAKQHSFSAFHTYQGPSFYTISTDACCWWDGLANITSADDAPFILQTSFSLTNGFDGFYNNTPTFNLPPYASADFNEALIYSANMTDVEEDSIVVKIEAIEEVLIPDYVLPTAIFANPNNAFSLIENTGNLLWLNPPPIENKYVLCLNIIEYRDGSTQSNSQQYIYFFIQDTPTATLSFELENKISLFPNPCSERFFLDVPTTMKDNIQAVLIYDQQGRLMSSHAYLEEGYLVNDFSAGIYRVQVRLLTGLPIDLTLVIL